MVWRLAAGPTLCTFSLPTGATWSGSRKLGGVAGVLTGRPQGAAPCPWACLV